MITVKVFPTKMVEQEGETRSKGCSTKVDEIKWKDGENTSEGLGAKG